MKKLFGIVLATVFAISALAATALAGPPPPVSSDLVPDGKVAICHFEDHNHIAPGGELEYDFFFGGGAYCENEGGSVLVVSTKALDGHKCFFDSASSTTYPADPCSENLESTPVWDNSQP